MYFFLLLKIFFLLCIFSVYADIPCVPRSFNESTVCVCNSTYCDTVTRAIPGSGNFIKYTSTKFGKRFNKTKGKIETTDNSHNNDSNITYGLVLELKPEKLYQAIEGFGGAVTDSAGISWKSLSPRAQQYLINSYFSKYGIEYNMIRLPAGSTDFSTGPYAYNEYPINDTKLSNFTLAPDDRKYKVDMVQECMKVATDEVKVVTGSWAPPNWMLENDTFTGSRYLKDEYYQTYADYFCKFAELFYGQGIKIWGLSAANEPSLPILGSVLQESTSWTVPKMVKFIVENLGPTIRNCSVQGIKILATDDQRFALPLWTLMSQIEPEILKDIDGLALHYYFDRTVPGALIARTMQYFPDKFIISTEACGGCMAGEEAGVELGSWTRAKEYILDILEDLNYNVSGWIDWNMCLDTEGGPTWLTSTIDSPIIVNAEKQEFYKQPMYYALGHFSKFIKRGSRRMKTIKRVPVPDPDIALQDIEAMGQEYFDNVAFLTPNGTIVVVIHNVGPLVSAAIKIGNRKISTYLDDESITTIEFPYNKY